MKKDKESASGPAQKKQENNQDKEFGCSFYQKLGHIKRECSKYHAWRTKKGTLLTLVCFEANLTSVPRHTWWMDSGATTHT